MARRHQIDSSAAADDPHFQLLEGQLATAQEPPAAWTEIEAGRFMPRRVRGSYLGRALG